MIRLLFLCILLTYSVNAPAMSKKELKSWGEKKNNVVCHPTREGTKERKAYLSAPNQCRLGVQMDSSGKITDLDNLLLLSGIQIGDQIISLNDQKSDMIDPADEDYLLTWFNPIALSKGDPAIFELERNKQALFVETTCEVSRAELIDRCQPLTELVFRDKPDKCLAELKKYEFEVDSPFAAGELAFSDACSRRAIAKRKLSQFEYNQILFQDAIHGLDWWERRIDLGAAERKEVINTLEVRIANGIDFLNTYGSRRLADSLARRYDSWEALVNADSPELSQTTSPVSTPPRKVTVSTAENTGLLAECAEIDDSDRKLMCYELAASLLAKGGVEDTKANSSSDLAKEDLLAAFFDIEALVDSGVSYDEYSSAVSELRSEVRKFFRRAEKEPFPVQQDIEVSIDRVLLAYEDAKNLWGLIFNSSSTMVFARDLLGGSQAFIASGPVYENLRSRYAATLNDRGQIQIFPALKVIWLDASIEIARLEDAF